jgi:hypothetical protein
MFDVLLYIITMREIKFCMNGNLGDGEQQAETTMKKTVTFHPITGTKGLEGE